jgi:large subunit ribosomal protein L18
MTVHRTNTHIYAQILDATGAKVLAAASTAEKEVRGQVKSGSSKDAAVLVGKRIAERAKAAGVSTVAFDRSGFAYHGRVKALADAAREAGLTF